MEGKFNVSKIHIHFEDLLAYKTDLALDSAYTVLNIINSQVVTVILISLSLTRVPRGVLSYTETCPLQKQFHIYLLRFLKFNAEMFSF